MIRLPRSITLTEGMDASRMVATLNEWMRDARAALEALTGDYARQLRPTPIQSGAYQAKAWDLVRVDGSKAPLTVSVPPSSANRGVTIAVANVTSSTNTITIGVSARGDTINGASSVTIASAYGRALLHSTGDGWVAHEVGLDHGALSGLGDDDHTQYLLINGTRAMTGDLNMGNNDINNAISVEIDSGRLDTNTVGSSYELHWEDEAGNTVNLTRHPISTQTSAFDLTDEMHEWEILCDGGESGFTVTVKDNLKPGLVVHIIQADTGAITIAGSGSLTVQGTTATTGLYDRVTVVVIDSSTAVGDD